MDRRLLVLEAVVLAEDLPGRFGKFVQVEAEGSLVPAEALGGRLCSGGFRYAPPTRTQNDH